MAKLKKGSAAAKAFMAKIRAAKGKTKVVKAKAKTKKVGSTENDIKVTSNVKNRTFTIKKNGTTYRTGKFSKPEFEELEYNTQNDWANFLRTQDNYSKVKTGAVKKVMPTKKASSMHKDTKSHNVNIRVVSGYKQTPEIILGRVGAVALLKSLAPEVKLRITRGKKVRTAKITSASDTADILKKFITPAKIQTQEYSFAMYLNNANNVLAVYQFGMGGFTATIMEKRLLMAAALKLGATAMILCHNHPSGNLTPSNADKIITKQISELANIHDIKVLDHVILTREGYYSFANEGLI